MDFSMSRVMFTSTSLIIFDTDCCIMRISQLQKGKFPFSVAFLCLLQWIGSRFRCLEKTINRLKTLITTVCLYTMLQKHLFLNSNEKDTVTGKFQEWRVWFESNTNLAKIVASFCSSFRLDCEGIKRCSREAFSWCFHICLLDIQSPQHF